MNLNDVLNEIEVLRKFNSESEKVEVKTAHDGFPKKCYDTISGFANKSGGLIIFGLDEENDFASVGVNDVNDLQKQLTSLCNDAMEPVIRPEFLSFEFEGHNLFAAYIYELPISQKPCFYKPKGLINGSYIRDGERDSLMTDYEIYALVSYNNHIIEDVRVTNNSCFEDLDEEKLHEYINKISNDKPNFRKNSFEYNLKICNVIEDAIVKKPTLAGTMVFGKYPQCFYPQLFVACCVIPGTEIGDKGLDGERFIDNRRVEGTIPEMLNETMNFLRRNMKIKVIVDSNGERTDQSEYPLDALREAVMNALIHRDYSAKTENAYISVYMYSDRIEIISPGSLYGSNTYEMLGTSERMETRNPNIVRLLEETTNLIENRQSGILVMKREMALYNMPEPEYIVGNDYFKVIFRKGNDNKVTNDNNQLDKYRKEVLEYCKEPKTLKEIREYLNLKSRNYVNDNIIKPLLDSGNLDYTNKENLRASNQKYVTLSPVND